MHIVSLDFKGFRGFAYRLKFARGITALVGMNGTGKTTVLDLISVFTGHEDAELFLHGLQQLEYAKIVVDTGDGVKTLELTDGYDADAVAAFRAALPHRASYVLHSNSLREDRLVTERREAAECHKDMLEWLERFQLAPNHLHFVPGRYATLLVSDTGAQRYLLTVAMRRAPSAVPMLLDLPERHLHFMIRRAVLEFYQQDHDHQIICATHCPELMASVEYDRQRGYPGDYDTDREVGYKRGSHSYAVAMDQESIQW